jgi:hypothetical protein
MIKQSWNILEEEKNRILSLHEDATKKHYLLREQNESRTESQTIPLNTNWQSGKWKLTANQTNTLTQQLNKITNFINQHKGSKVTIQIRAGESRVANYDKEVTPKKKLEPGVLSERRGSSLVEFLKGYFETLLKKGLISEMPNIPKSLSVIGNTPYAGVNDLNDSTRVAQYNAEQFVEAIISVEKKYDCVVGMQITIGYFEEKGQAGHQCDEAIFELKLNGVSLGEVNLNNGNMDYGLNVRDRSVGREKDKYQKTIQKLEKDWKSLVTSGQVKDNEKQKRKYFDQYLPQTQPEQMEYPNWVEGKAQEKGYKDINKFVNDLKTINNSFEKYGRPKYYQSGSRSQTFTIDGPLAQKIVSSTKANKLVLSIVPLVSPDGKYSIFYERGTHSDTPWVIIQTKDSKEMYSGAPNVNMKRGDLTEKVILETDLCGKEIKKP